MYTCKEPSQRLNVDLVKPALEPGTSDPQTECLPLAQDDSKHITHVFLLVHRILSSCQKARMELKLGHTHRGSYYQVSCFLKSRSLLLLPHFRISRCF